MEIKSYIKLFIIFYLLSCRPILKAPQKPNYLEEYKETIYNNCRTSNKILIYSKCCNIYIEKDKIKYTTKCSYIINQTQNSLIKNFQYKDSITKINQIKLLSDNLFKSAFISDTINQTDSRLVLVFESKKRRDTLSIFEHDMVLNDKYVLTGMQPFKILMNSFSRLSYMCPSFVELKTIK